VRGSIGDANISGTIGKDVRIEADSLTLSSTAKIRGDLTYKSEEKAKIEKGALVSGTIKHTVPKKKVAPKEPSPARKFASRLLRTLWSFLALALIGLVITFFAPQRVIVTGEKIASAPWKSLGLGFLLLITIPIGILLVLVTIIGIPLALIAAFGYVVALYATSVFVGFFVGERIINLFKPEKQIWPGYSVLLGLLILAILRLIPYLGLLVGLLVVLFGLGAMMLAEFEIHRKAREAGLA